MKNAHSCLYLDMICHSTLSSHDHKVAQACTSTDGSMSAEYACPPDYDIMPDLSDMKHPTTQLVSTCIYYILCFPEYTLQQRMIREMMTPYLDEVVDLSVLPNRGCSPGPTIYARVCSDLDIILEEGARQGKKKQTAQQELPILSDALHWRIYSLISLIFHHHSIHLDLDI